MAELLIEEVGANALRLMRTKPVQDVHGRRSARGDTGRGQGSSGVVPAIRDDNSVWKIENGTATQVTVITAALAAP